eukprot:TRINITY_DN557_c0_g1_i6.p1 TRINITY_DN557_c0_g1~~TRINITY_DN557_c0_g1_i6.p1  ORF type:complete len:353 (-),score=78.39 TRINITY_DN557_c0_g1_i6:47-1081(-)
MADRLVADGYSAVGYKYVDIDDCWLSHSRDSSGQLVANQAAFPSGIKALSDYIHSRGLLFGMYEDIGTYTCGGYPGSEGYFETDAKTFASWGVDALKLDGCYYSDSNYQAGYTNFSVALNKTGRPIMFSCSWPAYISDDQRALYYPYMAKICNIWRNWDDIDDSYSSMASIANYWGSHSAVLASVAKPGSFNDADQLIIGNSGLNPDESRTQMAIWSIIASPLLMSNDLRNIPTWAKDILQNKEVIAVNQDSLGRQGVRVSGSAGTVQVWTRLLADSSYAVALWNDTPNTSDITLDLKFVSGCATLRDLFNHTDLGVFKTSFTSSVPSHGTVMLKVTPAEPPKN